MNRAVFLDRDGVINRMVYYPDHGLIDSPLSPSQIQLLPGVSEAIQLINERKWPVLVVSNQPGVAKGKIIPQTLKAMDRKIKAELAHYGAHLDGIFYCLHHPDAIKKEYRKNCECRKPKPGLLLKAGKEFEVDLRRSYMIGDGLIDVLAGKEAGCKTILLGKLKCDLCNLMRDLNARPDFIISNLLEAARLIQQLEEKK